MTDVLKSLKENKTHVQMSLTQPDSYLSDVIYQQWPVEKTFPKATYF